MENIVIADNGRWLKLYPKILDSRVFSDEKCLKLWIWCLCKANYKVGYFQGQEVGPGSFVTGKFTGSEECEISTSAWYRGIEKLVEWDMITKTSNHHWTTISICNWQTYQQSEQPRTSTIEPPPDNRRTTSGQPLNPIVESLESLERKETHKASEFLLPPPFDTKKCKEQFARWFDWLAQHGKVVIDPQQSGYAACSFFKTERQLLNAINTAIANDYITLKNYPESTGDNFESAAEKTAKILAEFAAGDKT